MVDKMENREEQANIVSAATYINCPEETILARLQGKYDYGDGRPVEPDVYITYASDAPVVVVGGLALLSVLIWGQS